MYPILEFDDDREPIIDPQKLLKPIRESGVCLLTFFKEVVDALLKDGNVKLVKKLRTSTSEHPLITVEYNGKEIAVLLMGLGGPLSAGLLEEVIALGFDKFIMCGSSGVIDKSVNSSQIIVVDSAIRDEGTSYHYLPPSREVAIELSMITFLQESLDDLSVNFIRGKSWSTDGFYRETRGRVEKRLSEGAICVEMEVASLAAVAKYRGVTIGFILYGGDDLTGDKWKVKDLNNRSTRERLFYLTLELCSRL